MKKRKNKQLETNKPKKKRKLKFQMLNSTDHMVWV